MFSATWRVLIAGAFSAGLALAMSQGRAQDTSKQRKGSAVERNGQSASAERIILKASARNSVQIKALDKQGTTVWELQLGGGSNQPPSETSLTGQASTVIDGKEYSGYFRLSTDSKHQLQMKLRTAGKAHDEYSFLAGFDLLSFEFAPTSSFTNPWLAGQLTVSTATQQMPSQNNRNQQGSSEDNGSNHPPILLAGKASAPTGGSLAKLFEGGESRLTLHVGGNQRLSALTKGNTLSGMNLESGSLYPLRPKSSSP